MDSYREKIRRSTDKPKPKVKLHGQSHFSALQPVLSASYSKSQIHSLLSLALLFWQKPTFTDTQLGDSPHLFSEFLDPDREMISPLISEMFSSGESRLLLRDKFILPDGKATENCRSLVDVFEGWQKQNMPGAWVVPPDALNRERYMTVWNDRVPQNAILAYDYLDVKRRFQMLTRDKVSELSGRISISDIEGALRNITSQNWFSHSDVFRLLQEKNLAGSEIAKTFGLLDEAAYADSLASGLSAIGVPNAAVFHKQNMPSEAVEHISRIMSDAFGQVELTDLRLLSILKFEEIMRIRERGVFLKDEIASLAGKTDLSDESLKEAALALAGYWRTICSELDRLHPGATRKKTKFGLYVSSQTLLPVEGAIEGLSVVLSGLASILTGGPEGQSSLVRKVIDTLSFKFLLSGEHEEMRKLKSTLSKSAVLSSTARIN